MSRIQTITGLVNAFTSLFTGKKGTPPAAATDQHHETERPFGNLTHAEAESYFIAFCELMQEGIGFVACESRLPTSFERMKEVLKVQCLAWWEAGQPFDETREYFAAGILHLNAFVPEQMAAIMSREKQLRQQYAELRDRDQEKAMAVLQQRAAMHKETQAVLDFQLSRARELNLEWNEFVGTYRAKHI